MAVADAESDKPRVRDGTGEMERAWLAVETERRQTRWQKRKQGIDSARRMHRAGMTDLELHRSAVERAAKISTVSAPPVGRSSPNSERERPGPPAQQTLDQDPRWEEAWFVIRRRLEDIHRLLDEAEGLGATAVSTMVTEEKDRLILVDGRGYTKEAVVDLLGREVAGSPQTVYRVRRNRAVIVLGYAVSTLDGERLPDRNDPSVRRVRID